MKLSRREIIILAIIALVFIEVRLLISPGLNKLTELNLQLNNLQGEYEMINFNLTIAENSRKTRDNNLEEIGNLSEPFLDGVTPDSLLVYTHEMLAKHGLTPYSYIPAEVEPEILQPEQVTVNELTYQLKELAQQYRMLNSDGSSGDGNSTDTNSGNSGNPESDSTVENFSLQVVAAGTYEQMKSMMDDFTQLGKTLLISRLNISLGTGGEDQLNFEFTIDYYGIAKLTDNTDPLNEWKRQAFQSGTQSPFIQPSTTEPAVTEPVTEETEAAGG